MIAVLNNNSNLESDVHSWHCYSQPLQGNLDNNLETFINDFVSESFTSEHENIENRPTLDIHLSVPGQLLIRNHRKIGINTIPLIINFPGNKYKNM